MTSLPGGPSYPPFPSEQPQSKRPPYSVVIWAALAFLIVGGIVVGILGVRKVLNGQSETIATSSPEPLLTQTTSNATPPSVASTLNANLTTRGTPRGSETNKDLDPDPALFPADTRQQSSTPTDSPSDYDRIFRSNEIDQKARVLSKPDPAYTAEARSNQVVGTVVLRAVFSSSGQVTNISVIRALPNGLTERAIAAAKQIKFVPAMKDGHPASMWMQLEYHFNLY